MSEQISFVVPILSIEPVTHNVKRFKVARPDSYEFAPGQATEVAINKPEWKNERRPFTFTGLTDWDHLEFTIKIYDDHDGVTHQLGTLKAGDEVILHDVWGAIHYKGDGVFIAGGAGVTPFIAILRSRMKAGDAVNNTLIFSNRTDGDIILREEFENMLGDRFINVITGDETSAYDHRMIEEAYLREKITNTGQYFYICGPDAMIDSIVKNLQNIGIQDSQIVKEEW